MTDIQHYENQKEKVPVVPASLLVVFVDFIFSETYGCNNKSQRIN